MLTFRDERFPLSRGRVTRRDLLKVGMLGTSAFGLSELTLPDLLRARSRAGPKRDTSIVWLWLQGGAPHIETFDPKMEAPSEYRSMVGAVPTTLPGVKFGGGLPHLASMAHRMAIVRSFRHTNPDHLGASHYMLTAEDAPFGVQHQTAPSFGSIAAKVRGVQHPETHVPTFVRVSSTISFDFDDPMWLGPAYGPFDANGPNRQNLKLTVSSRRLTSRSHLLHGLDRLHRNVDQSDIMEDLDAYSQRAIDLVLGGSKRVFDASREDPRISDRYGPGLGAQLLAARRLCEAGCGFVTLNYCYAPHSADTPFAWDMHLGPGQPKAPPMPGQLQAIFPMFDQAISAFIEDVHQRGLSEKILLVITGDFGRTPKINQYGGRDHWPDLSTLALVGGGLRMGQVVGTSSPRAEAPTSRPIEPKDLLATILYVLGIDPDLQFPDYAGRPRYVLPEGAEPIAELI